MKYILLLSCTLIFSQEVPQSTLKNNQMPAIPEVAEPPSIGVQSISPYGYRPKCRMCNKFAERAIVYYGEGKYTYCMEHFRSMFLEDPSYD